MKKFLILLLVGLSNFVFAQPYHNEIAAFKKQDSLMPPPAHPIVFTGSSSFTKWTDVQQYFPGYTILNRGFGGSMLPDLIYYENDVIFNYHPRQIVIYCGDNDLASSDSVTAQIVFTRFKKLYADIRKYDPSVSVVYVSIKPSPSRWALKDKMIAANALIKNYLQRQKHASFVNIWNEMLDANGKPKADLFIADNLHMNAKGYAIWQKKLRPYLLK